MSRALPSTPEWRLSNPIGGAVYNHNRYSAWDRKSLIPRGKAAISVARTNQNKQRGRGRNPQQQGGPLGRHGMDHQIKDGIPCHAPTLMAQVKEIVAQARAEKR